MNILFIRHSETVLTPDKPNPLWKLSESGIAKSQKLALTDMVKTCEILFTSFQTKALETALILSRDNYIPIVPVKELTETSSVTNKYFANFAEEIEKWHKGGYSINGGEIKEDTLIRFNKIINQIISTENDKKTIGVVSHGNILSVFSEQYLDHDSLTIHRKMKMPDLALFDTNTKTFSIVWGEYPL